MWPLPRMPCVTKKSSHLTLHKASYVCHVPHLPRAMSTSHLCRYVISTPSWTPLGPKALCKTTLHSYNSFQVYHGAQPLEHPHSHTLVQYSCTISSWGPANVTWISPSINGKVLCLVDLVSRNHFEMVHPLNFQAAEWNSLLDDG